MQALYLNTLNPTPYTLNLHPTPYILHPTPYTLHPTPYILHPKRTPQTLFLQPPQCKDSTSAA